MQPLSPRVRAGYFYTFIGLFLASLPFVIMYADGWRWSNDLGFYKTGGIFVSVPYQDAEVRVDGVSQGFSGFFNRSFFVGTLEPRSYVIDVRHEDYLPWSRTVIVEPQLVTDAEALLFPKRIEIERLVVSGTATTGVAVIPQARYDDYLDAFATDSATSTATSTRADAAEESEGRSLATTTGLQDEQDRLGLFVRDGNVFVRWMSASTLPSSRFCSRPSLCVSEIAVERNGEFVQTARFFRGGVVYATEDGAIYFAEYDVRPTPLTAKLHEAAGADIRILDDSLIVQVGGALYRVNL